MDPSTRAPNGRLHEPASDGIEICPTDTVRLKRQLGLVQGVGIVTGLVIGGGIYISPKGVLAYAGSPGLSLVMWGIGGFLGLFGALTYAEIGLAIPESGALYAYIRQMYGSTMSFFYAWSYLFFVRTASNAVKCVMFGRYVLKPFFPDCVIPDLAVKLVAYTVCCALTLVNCVNVRWAARGQSAMTVISLLTLIVISGCGIKWTYTEGTDNLKNAFEGSSKNPGDWALALQNAIFSYYGWFALNFLVEELKNPVRNLPLSIAITVSFTTVLYVLVNYAYLVVLGSAGVLQSEAVAISIAIKVLGPLAWLMPIFISITACASFNSGLMVGSRLTFAGSRRGDLPSVLGLISVKFFTPITSLIAQCLLSLCYIWSLDIYEMITNMMFINLVFDLLVVIGFIRIRLRRRSSEAGKTKTGSSSFQLPLFVPILYAIVLTFLVIVSPITKPYETAKGLLVVLVTGLPYYLLVIVWKRHPATLARKYAGFSVLVQKLLYCVEQETDRSQ